MDNKNLSTNEDTKKYFDILQLTNDNELIIENLAVAEILIDLNLNVDIINTALIRNVECDNLIDDNIRTYKGLIEDLSELKVENIVDNTYEDYRNVLVIMAKDYQIIIIELACRLVKMRRYKKMDIENKVDYANESLYIYAPIAHRLGLGKIKTELEELALYFIDINSFKSIVKLLELKKNERDLIVENMVSQITEITQDNTSQFKVFGRSKSIYSIYEKTIKKGKKIETIFDLHAIRIICATKNECYLLLGLIHEKYDPIAGRFKDYIAMKKPNLYQSLHTAIRSEDGTIFEVQIRTFEMDDIAERGIAAHWLYKSGGNSNLNDVEEQLHLFRDVIGTGDEQTEEIGTGIFESSIYTFTPNRKIIQLPKNANVIDFAYRIHSKVAESMVGAIVNGKIQSYEIPLQNGDTVEIMTKSGVHAPNFEWLELAHTNHAKRKIRAYFKKQQEIFDLEVIIKGQEMFASYLKKLDINSSYMEVEKQQVSILRSFSFKRSAQLYKAIANKTVTFEQIRDYFNPKQEEIKLVNTTNKFNEEQILVKGADGIKKIIASCCNPIPGDEIVGVISSGVGIKIHRSTCPNVSNGKSMVEANWNIQNDIRSKYEVDLLCYFENRETILSDVVAIFSKQSIALKHIDSKVHGDIVKTKISAIVNDGSQLTHLINSLEQLKGVSNVSRVIK